MVAVVSIDGDAEGVDAHNWTTWVIAQDWFGGGTGVSGDPYLLENISIVVDSTSAGLTIQDSGAFFSLNNVSITNVNAEGNGLYLYNVENGTINDCNFLDNGLDGILMENANFTDLTDVTSTGNGDDGIHMINCVLNTISASNCSENTDDGIYTANCTYNVVSSSYFQTNGDDGLCLEDSDLNNATVEADDNIDSGFTLIDSDECIISDGEFWDNIAYGVVLTEDDGDTLDNTIYNNLFSGNGINAVDNSSVANNWDDGALGNDWDDYPGADLNDDGIGDDPYDISGSAGATDNYPIFSDGNEPVVIPLPTPDTNDDDDEEILLDSFYFEKSIIICILGISLALFAIKRVYQK